MEAVPLRTPASSPSQGLTYRLRGCLCALCHSPHSKDPLSSESDPRVTTSRTLASQNVHSEFQTSQQPAKLCHPP